MLTNRTEAKPFAEDLSTSSIQSARALSIIERAEAIIDSMPDSLPRVSRADRERFEAAKIESQKAGAELVALLLGELDPQEFTHEKLRAELSPQDRHQLQTSLESQGAWVDLKNGIDVVRDVVRTKKFAHAIFQELERLEKTREQIHVVDAGSGPLALWGVLAALKSPKVRATCLELSPTSYALSQEVIKRLGLQDRVEVKLVDAASFEPEHEIDLLISETMSSGLRGNEKIVQILNSLQPHISAEGAVLPSWVSVEASLAELETWHKNLDEVIYYNCSFPAAPIPFEKRIVWQPGQELDLVDFHFDLTDREEKEYTVLVASRVGLGEGRVLDVDQSLMTNTKAIPDNDGGMLRGSTFSFLQNAERSDGVRLRYRPGCRAENIEIVLLKDGEAFWNHDPRR